jgi:hypothetical protein
VLPSFSIKEIIRKYYQDNGKISMTYDDSVAKMNRISYSPSKSNDTMSSSEGFKEGQKSLNQTQYQMMNNYHSPTASKKNLQVSSPQHIRHYTYTNIMDSPNYSAQKTSEKFFRTIDESPFLGAGKKEVKHLPPRPSRNEKNRNNSMFNTGDAGDLRYSVAAARTSEARQFHEKQPFDSNIEHGLTFMERIVR